jgi:hypothetical protein
MEIDGRNVWQKGTSCPSSSHTLLEGVIGKCIC